VSFSCAAGLRELQAGELIHAGRHELHGLRAVEDASLLLTIVLDRTPGAG
jgi:quercetin dioxygenase-like cupin family protein